jgi:hypothetical protein
MPVDAARSVMPRAAGTIADANQEQAAAAFLQAVIEVIDDRGVVGE